MRLIVRQDDERTLRVEQDGGYSLDHRLILRAVSSRGRCEHGIYWIYPKSAGALMALEEAAELMHAELEIPEDLQEELGRMRSLTDQEAEIRRLMQAYMDDRRMGLSGYKSRTKPLPWRHQQLAYHWFRRVGNLYLAHKPGLGKTRSAVDIIRGKYEEGSIRFPEVFPVEGHYSQVFRRRWVEGHDAIRGGCLIMCPRIVMGTWLEQLWLWQRIAGLVVYSYSKAKKIRRAGIPAAVHVINYDSLHVVQDNEYDLVIADEAHSLANEDTNCFAYATHLRQKVRLALALSGTPVSNMLPSLWAQFFWLDGGRTLGPSFESYKRRYFDLERQRLIPKNSAESEIAKKISRVTYPLTMQEAFPDKPQKIQRVLKVPMSSEQRHYYRRVRQDLVARIQTGEVTVVEITQKMTKMLQICQGFIIDDQKKVYHFNSTKQETIREMLLGEQGEAYHGHTRTVVWCAFRYDQIRIVRMLQEAGVPVLWLHGDITRQVDRDRIINAWNDDFRYRVMVGMIQLGVGINLHAPDCRDGSGKPARCSNTIFYGLTWRVTQLEQAMDRVYRGDQVETCLYTYILSEDLDDQEAKPLDVRVYATLQQKLEQAKAVSEESVDYVRRLLGI